MMRAALLPLALLAGGTAGQMLGKQTKEAHPQLNVQRCTRSGGCATQQQKVVLDSNWRWTNSVGGYTNCFSNQSWNASVCGKGVSGAECAAKCALEGVDAKGYNDTYGVRTSGSALNLLFVTEEKGANGSAPASNVGSRTYLMADDSKYEMFKLKNREFSFDVDVSTLECGLNGALYFVEMDEDGGMARFPSNKAGAALGTGYCDAQCPHDLKWINGEANVEGWSNGVGQYGTCCIEMDIWEANKWATAVTPHACNVSQQTRCGPGEAPCGSSSHGGDRFKGVCDPNGCDIQPYRMGTKDFFGPGLAVDSTKPMTVVTQFITADGTDNADVVEIRRIYVQDGKTIPSPMLSVGAEDQQFDSVSDTYCQAEVDYFNDGTNFLQRGGMKAMSDALGRGMVLVMSLWDDHAVDMQWLDGVYPPGQTTPGAVRGPCPASSGKPDDVEKKYANASVTYANIRFGEINSTYGPSAGPSPPAPPFPVGPPPAPSPTPLPAQCGGAPVKAGNNCQTDPKGPNCCPIGASGKRQGCYEKNQYWAGCEDSCDPNAVDPYDGTKWSCKCLSTTCPSPAGAPPTPPTPLPVPSGGCPGGSLSGCMDLCPSTPAVAYKACVQNCVKRCN